MRTISGNDLRGEGDSGGSGTHRKPPAQASEEHRSGTQRPPANAGRTAPPPQTNATTRRPRARAQRRVKRVPRDGPCRKATTPAADSIRAAVRDLRAVTATSRDAPRTSDPDTTEPPSAANRARGRRQPRGATETSPGRVTTDVAQAPPPALT